MAASLIPLTQRLKFLVALRPGIISPTVAARQAATLDRLSGGRALFNLVTGGDPDELAADGLHLSHAERYEASVEFTRIWRRVLKAKPSITTASTCRSKAPAALPADPAAAPPLYFGVHPTPRTSWPGAGRPVPDLGRAAGSRGREDRPGAREAARHGRTVRFGIRLHVIVRETDEQAWAAADRLISHLDDDTIARAQASLARFDSVGQRRMAALHGGRRDRLVVAPNLWAGVGLVRGGAGTALVGDGPTVAARVRSTPISASTPSSFPATRTWKRAIGSPSCCSRIWTSPSPSARRAVAMSARSAK